MAVFDESEAPIPLETLGDVDRALQKVIRQARKGTIELPVAHMMVIALGTLAKMKQDRRDSRFKREVSELHDALVKKKPEPSPSPPKLQ